MSFPSPPDDHDNPYAPPSAPIGSRGFDLVSSSVLLVPFTVEGVMSHSWMIFKERLGACLGLFWAPVGMLYGLMAVFFVLLSLIQGFASQDTAKILIPVVGVVGYISVIALSYWITLGMSIVFLKIARMQETSFSDLFAGGPMIWTALGAGILATLIICGGVLVCMIPLGVAAAAFQGNENASMILGILGGVSIWGTMIVIATRLAPLNLVIVDHGPGVIGVLRQTFRMTAGHSWKIALFLLLFGAIYFAGFLACGVGIIFALPFIFLMYSVMYVAMLGKPVGQLPGIGPGDFPSGSKPYSDPDFGGLA